MKKLLFLLPLITLLISCDENPIYSVNDTIINISAEEDEIYNSKMKVKFQPENDEVFYLTGIIQKEDFDSFQDKKEFMETVLESEYYDYKEWAENWKQSHPNDPVAKFRNWLSYSNSTKTFKNLTRNTDYIVYAFVVDPDLIKATGTLYQTPLTTANDTAAVQIKFKLKWVSGEVQVQPDDLNAPYYCFWYNDIDETTLKDTDQLEQEFYDHVNLTLSDTYYLNANTGFLNVYYDADWVGQYQVIYLVGYDDLFTSPMQIYSVDYTNHKISLLRTVEREKLLEKIGK